MSEIRFEFEMRQIWPTKDADWCKKFSNMAFNNRKRTLRGVVRYISMEMGFPPHPNWVINNRATCRFKGADGVWYIASPKGEISKASDKGVALEFHLHKAGYNKCEPYYPGDHCNVDPQCLVVGFRWWDATTLRIFTNHGILTCNADGVVII